MRRPRSPRFARFHVLSLVATILAALSGCQGGEAPPPIDAGELERIEDLSESLANDLLDLSLATRQMDTEGIAARFADRLVATPLPATPGDPTPVVKWVATRPWPPLAPAAEIARGDFTGQFTTLLERFTSIEDARFKLKASTFADARHGSGRVFWYVIGRDEQGRREWLKATVLIEAERASERVEAQRGADASAVPATVDRPDEERWRITQFDVQSLESETATADIFSEVAQPAGIALSLPAFGEPGNGTFAWNGAAAEDVDRDGDLDLFVVGEGGNHLYLNDGNGRFVDRAAEASLRSFLHDATGPLFLDYDGDGDSDLFVASVGEQMLFENRLVPDGALTFRDVSATAGVAVPGIGFSAVAGDVDADGRPDIYVCCYNSYGKVMPNSWDRASNGSPNLLFINRGDGTFVEQAAARGVAGTEWSYAAQFVDVDGDRDQDLYVANDFGIKNLFRNDGDRFTDIAAEVGLLDPGNGMGVCFGDYDNDGDLDLHLSNMSSTAGNRILSRLTPPADAAPGSFGAPEVGVLKKLASGNTLYERLDDGSWKNVTADIGGLSAGWAWGGGFIDFDNDGWEDMYTANGFVSGKSMKDT